MRSIVSDCSKLDAEIDALNEEIQVVAGLVSQCIKENAITQQSQVEYNKKYNRLVKRYEKAVDRLKKATAERESRMQRDRDLRIFISSIKEQPLVLEIWDEGYGSRCWKRQRYTQTTELHSALRTEQTSMLGLDKPRLFYW